MKLVLASNNKNKLAEIRKIMEPLGYQVISQSEAGIDLDVEETGKTFEENAALKARAIHRMTGSAVISDDSGLEVDYLDGAPGVYSHRFAGEDATDEQRCQKLLEMMENAGDDQRTARFVCVICYISEDGTELSVRGTVEGMIGREPAGSNGFGYDPVFMYHGQSFAQISSEEKNKVSHRADALAKLSEILNK